MQSQITVRLDKGFQDQIAKVARRLRRKRSDIVRLVLEKFISEIEGLDELPPYDQVKGLIGSASSGIPNLREPPSQYRIRADAFREGGTRRPAREVRDVYKEKISAEIQGFSEAEMEKIIKMIRLIKNEFFAEKDKARNEGFKKARGAWKDVDIDEIYKKLDKEWKDWKPPVFA